MQLFSSGRVYDFMRYRTVMVGLSATLVVLSLFLVFSGRAKLGTDFRGGTEVELAFEKPVTEAVVRQAVAASGFASPDVVRVADDSQKDRFLIRVQEVSTIAQEKQDEIARALCFSEGEPPPGFPAERVATEVRFSPGGDKITVRYKEAPDLGWVATRMQGISGLELRSGGNNPFLQNARDHKVEIQIKSRGDQIMDGLRSRLGADTVPQHALRVEWIGPKAGAQLRNSAVKSVLISIVLIMVYVAFRFDVRFAPGGVIALFHDSVGTLGVMVLLGKEITLTTIAALLTIIGFSINDTVVVYDRVRENLPKMRGATFRHIINTSTSEMLGRTLLTSGTVLISLLAFFVWGTGALKDFALALVIGLVLGTYSSVYVALPLTEWLDARLFARLDARKNQDAPRTPTGDATAPL